MIGEVDLDLLQSWAESKGTRPSLRLCRASGWTTALLAAAVVSAIAGGKRIVFLAASNRQIPGLVERARWLAAALGFGALASLEERRDIRWLVRLDGGGELEFTADIRRLVGFPRKDVVTDHARLRLPPLSPMHRDLLDEVGGVDWDLLKAKIEQVKWKRMPPEKRRPRGGR